MFFGCIKKASVVEAVRLFTFPSRLVGLFPATFEGKKFVTTRASKAVSIAICSFLWLPFSFSMVHVRDFPSQTYVTEAVNFIDALLLCFIPCISLFELIRSLHLLNRALKAFREAELLIALMGKQAVFCYPMFYLWLECGTLVIAAVTDFIDCLGSGLRSWGSLLQLGMFYVELVFLFALAHRYYGLMGMGSALVGQCSHCLRSFSKPQPARAQRVEALSLQHSRLCDVSLMLNDSQALQVLLTMCLAIFVFVTDSYESYDALLRPNSVQKFLKLFLKLSWFSALLVIAMQITGACADFAKKAKEFNVLLYQLMIDDQTNEIVNNKKLRLHISMNRNVVFTACGFFTLDYTLVHSMIAAATTYLVILIQFGQLSSSDGASNATAHS